MLGVTLGKTNEMRVDSTFMTPFRLLNIAREPKSRVDVLTTSESLLVNVYLI